MKGYELLITSQYFIIWVKSTAADLPLDVDSWGIIVIVAFMSVCSLGFGSIPDFPNVTIVRQKCLQTVATIRSLYLCNGC